MVKSIRIILFLTVIFVVLGFTIQEQVKDLINGQEWMGLSPETKKGYMMGFQEGLMIAQTAVMIEKKDIKEGSPDSALLDRIDQWIEAYKVGSSLLDQKVETADGVFKKETYQSIMVAAVLPLVAKRVRGEINDVELTEKLKQLHDVLKNE